MLGIEKMNFPINLKDFHFRSSFVSVKIEMYSFSNSPL